MSDELRELLTFDQRCWYCRQKTSPPHTAKNCPDKAAKKARVAELAAQKQAALRAKLEHLNNTRGTKRAHMEE
jgi:hypothetical protein